MVHFGKLLPIHTEKEPVAEAFDVLVFGVANFVADEFADADFLEGCEVVFGHEVIEFFLHELLSLRHLLLLTRL